MKPETFDRRLQTVKDELDQLEETTVQTYIEYSLPKSNRQYSEPNKRHGWILSIIIIAAILVDGWIQQYDIGYFASNILAILTAGICIMGCCYMCVK